MICSGRKLLQAMPQGLEARRGEVLVQIGRIDLAAIFRGHVLLRPQERTDRPVANVDRSIGHRVGVSSLKSDRTSRPPDAPSAARDPWA